MQAKNFLAGALALGLLTAACGSDGDDSTSSPTTQDSSAMTGDSMGAMDDGAMEDGMAMNMGDPLATPAADVEDADLARGTFELLDTRPQGYDDLVGTADLARHGAGTTVTVELDGLKSDTEFISHLHDGPCADAGGDHYKFDPDGADVPPNEIHLAFTSDAEGHGFMTAENEMTAGPEAISVVVHPKELLDNKIACAELEL